jgi:hypothetical protein
MHPLDVGRPATAATVNRPQEIVHTTNNKIDSDQRFIRQIEVALEAGKPLAAPSSGRARS